MIFSPIELKQAITELERIFEKGKRIKIEQEKEARTNLQNRALHLFFDLLSKELTNAGIEFHYEVPIIGIIITPYSSILVKEYIWKPIQKALFNIDSTTDITTQQINEILDLLTVHYGQLGIPVTFPNQFDLYLKSLSSQDKF